MSSDFEELLSRLDSDDQETRQNALEELEAIFRGPRPPRVELRQQIRAVLDRWDADEAAVRLDAQAVGDGQTRKGPRAVKESSPDEIKPDSSDEAGTREDAYDSQRPAMGASRNNQPRETGPSRDDSQSLHGSWSGMPRPEIELKDDWDPNFLGEVARPFYPREETHGDTPEPLAVAVRVRKDRIWVDLRDGRVLGVPIVWFPRLAKAHPRQQRHVVIDEAGRGLHWPDLDEDLGVAPLLAHPVTLPAPEKGRVGNRRPSCKKKARITQDRRLRRAWEEFALAEGGSDAIHGHRVSTPPTPRMRDDKLNEIEAHHLGPLPADLSDRAVPLYLDAVDDIAVLVSEVWRQRASMGREPTTDPGGRGRARARRNNREV